MNDNNSNAVGSGGIFVDVEVLASSFFDNLSLETILAYILENRSTLLAGSGFIFTGLISLLVARFYYRTRNFLGRCNVSLNFFKAGGAKRWKLEFRTLLEERIADMIENRYAEVKILYVAKRLNPKPWWKFWVRHAPKPGQKQSFLQRLGNWRWIVKQKLTVIALEDEDHQTVMKSFLNAISEIFPDGHMAEALGLPTHTGTFVFWLTCEWDPMVWASKIRVFLLSKEQFDLLGNNAEEFTQRTVEVDSPSYWVRLDSLKEAALLYEQHPKWFSFVKITMPAG